MNRVLIAVVAALGGVALGLNSAKLLLKHSERLQAAVIVKACDVGRGVLLVYPERPVTWVSRDELAAGTKLAAIKKLADGAQFETQTLELNCPAAIGDMSAAR